MRTNKTEKMVTLSLLSAIAYLLMLFEIPILPMFGWLKLDFSDIPVLIATFLYGPFSAIIVAFIRSTLHFITSGGNIASLIGDSTGFIASVLYMYPVYLFMKKRKSNTNLIVGLLTGTILLTVFMSIANYFIITPFYLNVLGMDFGMSIKAMVLYGIVPFNLMKGTIVGAAFFVVYKSIMPVLERRIAKQSLS